jgi:hypothetical protein
MPAMMKLINTEIIEDRRSPEEYTLGSVRREGTMIYIGMSSKMSPLTTSTVGSTRKGAKLPT